MSDIAEIKAHLVRAQAAYDKLPLSGPVTSWCELYGEDLLDSCTKLLAALKQRTELIDAAAGHWLESCRTTSPPIAWEGAIDGAMEAVCKEVERLRARIAELEVQLEQSRRLGKLGGYPCTPEHTWAEWLEDRHRRVAELEAAQEWRPIESLESGDRVLLWFAHGEKGNGGMETAMVFRDGDQWSFWTHGGPNSGSDWVPADDERPTHWMPLPAPPKVTP